MAIDELFSIISRHSCEKIRTLYLRSIALCYAVAFYSLYTQIPGLYGSNGLLPVETQLDLKAVGRTSLVDLFLSKPTVLWTAPLLGLSVSQMMEIISLLGTAISLVLTCTAHHLTKLWLAILWLAYLSLYHVGQTFLWFQWDILLLEAGFLAIIAAPLTSVTAKLRRQLPSDQISLFLVRWLLFRMMFASGCVKLTSGCPTWWGLTAMPTHYFSQCLPTPVAWLANLLPGWMQRLSVVTTFVIEIPLTFLFFAPTSSLRKFTLRLQFILMVSIMLTGNYNFFNFLYLALCISLADDSWLYGNRRATHPVIWCLCCLMHCCVYAALGWTVTSAFSLTFNWDFTVGSSVAFSRQDFDRFLGTAVPLCIYVGGACLMLTCSTALLKVLRLNYSSRSKQAVDILSVVAYSAVAAAMFGLSLPAFTGQLDRQAYERVPQIFKAWDSSLDKLQLTSSYGLFRRMTGVGGRPEIIIEGSNSLDGPWKEYDFLYKPGNVSIAPKFCLPHQPRLDWQMWFAALGNYQQNPWFISLIYRLLKGQPEVLSLLDTQSPWVNEPPPKYIRALLYKYHFSSWGSGADWWRRSYEGEYLPTLSLADGQLEAFMRAQGWLASPQAQSELFANLLSYPRRISNGMSPHLQIWSFAWLAVPLIRPLA